TRSPSGRPRRLHSRFRLRPIEVLGHDRVTGVRFERTCLVADGGVVGTGELLDIDAQLVLRSVGYRGLPIDGLPFDAASGTIPNDAGRVLRSDAASPGEYVAGWIKRGPPGVIGPTRSDAAETIRSWVADHAP